VSRIFSSEYWKKRAGPVANIEWRKLFAIRFSPSAIFFVWIRVIRGKNYGKDH
jgi:hypothetical protein